MSWFGWWFHNAGQTIRLVVENTHEGQKKLQKKSARENATQLKAFYLSA